MPSTEMIGAIKKLMAKAMLEMEAKLLEAEYEYWTEYGKFLRNEPNKFLELIGIK